MELQPVLRCSVKTFDFGTLRVLQMESENLMFDVRQNHFNRGILIQYLLLVVTTI